MGSAKGGQLGKIGATVERRIMVKSEPGIATTLEEAFLSFSMRKRPQIFLTKIKIFAIQFATCANTNQLHKRFMKVTMAALREGSVAMTPILLFAGTLTSGHAEVTLFETCPTRSSVLALAVTCAILLLIYVLTVFYFVMRKWSAPSKHLC